MKYALVSAIIVVFAATVVPVPAHAAVQQSREMTAHHKTIKHHATRHHRAMRGGCLHKNHC